MKKKTHFPLPRYIFIFLFAIFITLPTYAQPAGMRPAFVKIGTFILSDENLVKSGNRYYCKIVGYIPVGTVVYYDPDKSKKVLFNKKKPNMKHTYL